MQYDTMDTGIALTLLQETPLRNPGKFQLSISFLKPCTDRFFYGHAVYLYRDIKSMSMEIC